MQFYKPDEFYGIGQVWGFKVKSKDVPTDSTFTKLMETLTHQDLLVCSSNTCIR